VTLSGDYVGATGSGGLCSASGGIVAGDTAFVYEFAHPDFVQINEPPNASQPLSDLNIYMQRVRYSGLGLAPLVQSGAYPGSTALSAAGSWALNATTISLTCPTVFTGQTIYDANLLTQIGTVSASGCTGGVLSLSSGASHASAGSGDVLFIGANNLTSSGTSVVVTNPATGLPPQVGDFIEIDQYYPGSNEYQYRQITRVDPNFATNGEMNIDRPFSPDVVNASWHLALTVANIACVECSIGGNATTGIDPIVGLPTGNSTSKAQWQNGVENWIWTQVSYGYGTQSWLPNNTGPNAGIYTAGAQGQGFGMRNVAILDSAIGLGCTTAGSCSGSTVNGGATMPLYQSTGVLWASTNGDGTPVYDGYVFDNDNYNTPSFGGTTFNPGSNLTNQQVTVNDNNYRPMGGTLTTQVRGRAGNGVPLFPFNVDGVPTSSGALIGSMQP